MEEPKSTNHSCLFILAFCIGLLMVLQTPAYPGEICAHGIDGQVQDKGADATYTGWGIDYDVAGTGSWLQYPIQIESGTRIKAIRILFSRSGTHYKDGWIRNVHVYDGNRRVKSFDNLYTGKGDPNKTINKVLSMQPIQFHNGIGISILPETKNVGGLKAIVNMEFHAVCVVTSP